MTYAVKVTIKSDKQNPFVYYIGLREESEICIDKVCGCKSIKTAQKWMENRIAYDNFHKHVYDHEYEIISL